MGALRNLEATEATMPTLSLAEGGSQHDERPLSEPPPSGVRLRSSFVEEPPVSISPISIAPASAANANAGLEGEELPLEEAIPLSHNAILAILFGATTVLSAVVLAFMPS